MRRIFSTNTKSVHPPDSRDPDVLQRIRDDFLAITANNFDLNLGSSPHTHGCILPNHLGVEKGLACNHADHVVVRESPRQGQEDDPAHRLRIFFNQACFLRIFFNQACFFEDIFLFFLRIFFCFF